MGAIGVDFFHHALVAAEGAVLDPDLLSDLELDRRQLRGRGGRSLRRSRPGEGECVHIRAVDAR